MLKKLLQAYSIGKNATLLIVLGTISWSLTMVKSGITYPYGMGFWGPNGHDGVWHIALSESLAKGSWQIPVFAGQEIRNYHLGFDLILSIIHKITFIPVSVLYFQVMPPVLAFLTGYAVYRFVLLWKKRTIHAWWATFFVYFGGGFGWIVSLYRNSSLGGESIFWSQQSISTLVNPPFAMSLLIVFAGLCFLVKGLRTKESKLLVISTFLFGFLIQVKVYAGLLTLAGLFLAGFWVLFRKKGISLIKVATGSLILSVLLFSPMDASATQIITFQPFWFLEEMMSASDRLFWPQFSQIMMNYKLGGFWVKATLIYLIAFFVFLVGNMGTRILALRYYFERNWKIKNVGYLEIFATTVILAGVIIPTFFVQTGTAWNTIQFFYYSLTFLGILSGIWVGEFIGKPHVSKLSKGIFISAVFLFTLPTTLGTLVSHYLPPRPPAKISSKELDALIFLKRQPEGIVITKSFDKQAADDAVNDPPRPLYLYESTAYVSAFSTKPVFIEDEVNLNITGYDWQTRRAEVVRIFSSDISASEVGAFMKDRNVSYIYITKEFNLGSQFSNLEQIYDNGEVRIYKTGF